MMDEIFFGGGRGQVFSDPSRERQRATNSDRPRRAVNTRFWSSALSWIRRCHGWLFLESSVTCDKRRVLASCWLRDNESRFAVVNATGHGW